MKSLKSNLRVAALPIPIESANPEANIKYVEEACAKLPKSTDILVLPELFTTGFHPKMDFAAIAETDGGKVIPLLKELAKKLGIAIAGSVLFKEKENLYNRAFFIEPSDEDAYYDKHHLFTASAEGELLTAGTIPPPVIRFRGWNISMVTCYDLRFPAWCRNRDGRYDLLLVPANWPVERAYAWKHLLIARAIENQSAVVGANRSGEDKFGHYDGQTYIFDCQGQPVGVEEDYFILADLDKSAQNDYRAHFPALNEADKFIF